MANSDHRYEMLRDRELWKLSWVVCSLWCKARAGLGVCSLAFEKPFGRVRPHRKPCQQSSSGNVCTE